MKFTPAAVAAACLLSTPKNRYDSDASSTRPRPPNDQNGKEKKGCTRTVLAVFVVVLLLGLAFYAGQTIRGSSNLAGFATTRGGGGAAAASLMMMSNEAVESGCYWCPVSCAAGGNCCHCKYHLPTGAICSTDNQCLSGLCHYDHCNNTGEECSNDNQCLSQWCDNNHCK